MSGADGKNGNGNPLLPEEAEMVLECSAGRRCYEWTASIRLVAM